MAEEIKSNRRVNITSPSKNTEIPKIVKIKNTKEPNLYKCCYCGETYTKLDTNFPASQSELYAGLDYHLPVCRKCLDNLYEHYTVVYGGDEDSAIRMICKKFDIYFNQSLLNASRKITKNRSRIHTYISRANLTQYRNKTYDSTLDEERDNKINSIEEAKELKANGEISSSVTTMERWGFGIFPDEEYKILDDHYKMLKKYNPNCDNNQEIFIKSLCHLNLIQTKALKENNTKNYIDANSEYAKTFKQAGLKTVAEKDSSNDETFCMTLGFISEYTPEEFYLNKELYKDNDNLGDYVERHITRAMINLETGSTTRDTEFFVPEGDDYDEE